MYTQANARPVGRGRVIGLSLGRFAFVGAGVALMLAGPALAGPEGAQVVRGRAKFHQNGNVTRIRVSDGAIINYDRFNIGAGERVRFVQPDASSRVLNRISGDSPTRIDGTLRANGNVYFVNPAGVTFGNGAVIDVGGLYAAAGNITNRDFINNVNRFTGLTGSVVNEGSINTDGGVAALIGREVANRGVITADKGVVAMVAGEDVVLSERGSTISVRVEGLARTEGAQVEGVGVENSGTVSAKRGRALMVAGDMYSLAINNTGRVQARHTTIEGQGNATVKVGGEIDARNAANGDRGGTVEITGQRVVLSDAKIDASGKSGGGTVHIGGELQGGGTMRTADTTLVSTGTEIRADATQSGDGGQIVVWADNHTGFYGTASAEGGAQAGDGGFIETSGKETLDIRGGRVSAAAKAEGGKGGTWLLDPRNVTIDAVATSGGAFDAGNPDTFTPNADDAVVDVADIVMALEGGTSVQILTGNTGAQDGNITVASAINKTAGGDATLTLRAANDINVNADITSTAGALTVELLANDATNGNDDLNGAAGSVSIASGVTIDTFGGDLVVRGEGFAADAMSTIAAGAGMVDVNVGGNVTLGAVSADALTVVADGSYQGLGATGLNITNNASITTTAGGIELGATTVGGTFQAVSNGGDITQTDAIAITGTSTFIARNGTGGEIFLTDSGNSFGDAALFSSRLGDDSAFGDGDINVVATGTLPVSQAVTTGDLRLTADDFDFTGTIRGDASIGLQALTPGTSMFIGGSGAGASLSLAELAFLEGSGSLSFGGMNTGDLFIGDEGAIDLSGQSFTQMTLEGGLVTFANGITLPDNAFAHFLTGAVDGSNMGVDITIGGVNGSAVFETSGAVDIDTDVRRVSADLSSGSFTLRNAGDLRIADLLSVTGITVAANEDVDVTAGGSLTVNFGVTASGTGAIRMRAEGGDAGDMIVNAAIASADGDISLSAQNDFTLNATGSVASATGTVAITADSDDMTSGGPTDGGSISTATGSSLMAGAALSLAAGGDIDLATGATISAGTVFGMVAGGDIDVRGTLTADSFQFDAGNDVNVLVDLATTGAMGTSIVAGGLLTVDTGVTISTMGNPLSLTVGDLDLRGMLDSGMGNVAIEIASAGTVGIGNATGDLTVDGDEISRITAAQLSIGGANATVVTTDGLTDAQTDNIGEFVIDATGNGGRAVFSGDESTFNALTVNADDGIDVQADLTTDTGDLVLNGDFDTAADMFDNIVIGEGVLITTRPGGGSIVLSAFTGGIIGESDLTIDSVNDLTINHAVSSPGILNLLADGAITLNGSAHAEQIMLEAGAGITLNQNVGTNSGEFRANADADADGTGTFTLGSGMTIQTGMDADIRITAADIDLAGSLDAGEGEVLIERSNSGTVGLGAAAGDMQLSQDELSRITAEALRIGGTNTTMIAVDALDASGTAGIETELELITADVDIAGAFGFSPRNLVIRRNAAGTVGLGVATGDMTIDNDELGRMSGVNLTVGGGLTGAITVSAVTEAASDGLSGTVTLVSDDVITFSSGASTFNAIAAEAQRGIRVNANITADTGSIVLDGDSNLGGPGDNTITFTANRVLTAAGGISLAASGGGMSGAGALRLLAGDGITISHTLAASGTTVMNADTDGDGGAFNLATGATLSSGNSSLTITASTLSLGGSLNSGAGRTSILRSTDGTVGLGTATGADMTINSAALQRITSTGLVIGGEHATRITVGGITTANVSAIAGPVTLDALANGGQVEFSGAASTFNALDVNADNGIRVMARVATQTGDLNFNPNADNAADGLDAVLISDDIAAGNTNDVNFNGNVRVGQNTVISGENVRFRGTVRSQTATARTLTVNTANNGVTLFERRVGGGDRPLAAITTNADGTTRIAADITTSGGTMTFNDAVRILSDVTLTDSGGTGIFFNGLLDAAAGMNPRLTLLWRANNLPGDNALPIVSFTRDVGGVNPFREILFNFDETLGLDGRVNTARIATIIARPRNTAGQIITNPTSPYSITFNTTGAFHMGRNEKLTVGGNVTINAGSAILGDITALGNITVNAPTIMLNTRLPGTILGPDNTVASDAGLDFVSGGEFAFSSVPTLIGSRSVSFATPDGTGDANGNLVTFLFQAFGEVLPSFLNAGTAPNIVTLDLRSQGPTNTNVSDALAGAIPRETRFNDVGDNPTVGQAQIEDLRQLGIIPRTLDLPELLQLLVGWGLYNDYPSGGVGGQGYTTAVNRLPGDEVTALLRDYDALFNRDLVDENGNPVLDEDGKVRRVSRASEIQEELYQSVRRFLTANPGTTSIDPVRFREYLDTTESESLSRGYVEELYGFLRRLELIGLTQRELALSKNVLLAPVRPRGITTIQQFEAVIRGSEMATTAN